MFFLFKSSCFKKNPSIFFFLPILMPSAHFLPCFSSFHFPACSA